MEFLGGPKLNSKLDHSAAMEFLGGPKLSITYDMFLGIDQIRHSENPSSRDLVSRAPHFPHALLADRPEFLGGANLGH